MSNIDLKFEVWKNKLLDLGRRNRLLNYRDTVASTIKITYPECFSLYDYFVENEKPIKFMAKKEVEAAETTENPETLKLPKGTVLTTSNEKDLLKILKNLRSKAKTVTEEQGVNVLYLSFGFLKWIDIKDKDTPYTSPLVLVPVRLTIESITSPYILKLHEDEIVVNPTLAFKLKNDYNVTLPDLDEFEKIEDFFEKVKEILPIESWSITNDVSLSLLSFLKINMYEDLNKHKDSILSNKIIKLISGDTSVIDKIPEELIDYNFDENDKPTDVYQIMDADSSQQDAILFAKKGISFVLQGPPGTGKSQTISNLIAECLANGKKVLFVSEKMAALDVVHKRLAGAGLDDFCLVLHSYKANKRSILDQLEKVLVLSENKVNLSDEAAQKLNLLQAKKQKLNDYAKEVYKKIQPLGKSVYEANGVIANLMDYDDLIFELKDIRNVTGDQYNNYIAMISQFVSTVGKMSGDYKTNPWRNTNLQAITNEYRHDANSKLPLLSSKLGDFNLNLTNWFQKLYINSVTTINEARKLLGIFNLIENSPFIPVSWIVQESLQPLYDEVEILQNEQSKINSELVKLNNEYASINNLDKSLNISEAVSIADVASIENERNKISSILSGVEPYCLWQSKDYSKAQELFKLSKEKSETLKTIKNEVLSKYEEGILNIDYNRMLARMKTEYNSMFKMFNKNYKEDKKVLQLNAKEIGVKIDDAAMQWIVTKLQSIGEIKQWFVNNNQELNSFFAPVQIDENTDYQAFEMRFTAYSKLLSTLTTIETIKTSINKSVENETKYKNQFQSYYAGLATNWQEVKNALDWAGKFKASIQNVNITIDFITGACTKVEFKGLCKECKAYISSIFSDIGTDYAWFVDSFSEKEGFNDYKIPDLQERLNSCLNGMAYLEEWIDYNRCRKECESVGLSNFIDALEKSSVANNSILPIFKKRFFRLWIDSVMPELPAVLGFRRKTHEGIIEDFKELDTLQFEIAKARIRANLINQLPAFDRFTVGVDEISILKRELKKQRRIMPIRKLFKEIPNLLLKMKPCLMMSPLSVSLFLEADTYKFDIVIFDEASQVCTENSIGAISRGNQVVITGDSKQLPPTSFFQATVGEDDYDVENEEELEDVNIYESILDEANMLPERTLRWHYRSKYESLIAFSNAKIYRNTLITFPSNTEKLPNTGVEYIYVPDGYYDTGGKKGNVIEAQKVAELVFQHFKEEPKRSLGVVAFGEVQQQAIEKIINEMRLQNSEYEKFFAEGIEDEFFIKNLENVQGDERDTIIFSIGYAKDSNGIFRMLFGPLSKSGGERRLNVAITRAKRNVKLVGSIMPNDIITEKISSEGPKLLRSYIDFAINGEGVLQNDIKREEAISNEQTFESAICSFLTKKGYSIGTNIGCSEYRIDIGVKHPTLEGIYVLGVETDGAAYHSARIARERDRTRKSVLESMGWKMYRIWSTDWIKDPALEGEKLVEAIENAIISYGEKNEKKVEQADSDDFINLEKKETLEVDESNPYNFQEFKPTDISTLPLNEEGHPYITDCIMSYVQNEYPLHYDLLCQYIAPAIGNEKVTVRVKREVDEGLSALSNIIVKKGDFLYPKSYEKITIKAHNPRKIQHISNEELTECIMIIINTCIGVTKDGLISETAKAMGFSRLTQPVSEAISSVITILLENGTLSEEEGKIKL